MGLTSAQDTPKNGRQPPPPSGADTPQTPTPVNILDTVRKGATPGNLSLKEQERMFDEIKKENFDLKLKCYHYEERLRSALPANIEVALRENTNLQAQNEALNTEIRSLKELLAEAQSAVESQRRTSNKSEMEMEVARLRQELDLTNGQLARTQNQCKKYETELELYDNESRDTIRKVKQLELELANTSKKLTEASNLVREQGQEISELQNEVEMKNQLVQQIRQDMRSTSAELELMMRKHQDLEQRLKISEAERESLANERDPIKRQFDHLRGQLAAAGAAAPSSPRSSMDILESKLMREMGQAEQKLGHLQKKTNLTQAERDALYEQSRRHLAEIQFVIRKVSDVIAQVMKKASIQSKLAINSETTIEAAMDEFGRIMDALLSEYEDSRMRTMQLQGDLSRMQEEAIVLSNRAEKAAQQMGYYKEQLASRDRDLEESRLQLQQVHADAMRIEQNWKVLNLDVPKYQEQIASLNTALCTMETELGASERRLQGARQEVEVLRRKCTEAETQAANAMANASGLQEEIARGQRKYQDQLQKLTQAETLCGQLTKRIEELQARLEQTEKSKEALEDHFDRELRNLHVANSDLKSQLASATSGKSSIDQRFERLQSSLQFVENENSELVAKLHSRDAAYSSLMKEYEIIKVEKASLERELTDNQSTVQRLENEVARYRKSDLASRKNNENVEHLQAKIESLVSINSFLKEQIESKEKALKEAEDKLHRQEDNIRKAYYDCEQQHQKIRKREQIIGRALKRLEKINEAGDLKHSLFDEDNPMVADHSKQAHNEDLHSMQF